MYDNPDFGEQRLTLKGYDKFLSMIYELRYRPLRSFIQERPRRFKPLDGRRKGRYSMRYDKGRRLEFSLSKPADGPETAVIHSFGAHLD